MEASLRPIAICIIINAELVRPLTSGSHYTAFSACLAVTEDEPSYTNFSFIVYMYRFRLGMTDRSVIQSPYVTLSQMIGDLVRKTAMDQKL